MLRTKSFLHGAVPANPRPFRRSRRGVAGLSRRTLVQLSSEVAMRSHKAVFFMHGDRPVTRLPIDAAPGKWPGLRARLMLMLGASIICATALGAQAPNTESGAKPAVTQAKEAAPGDFVGSDTCATCHRSEER